MKCEVMQWAGATSSAAARADAEHIVAWINRNGGEARYEPHVTSNPYDENDPGEPAIAVRTINGWAYAAPGHYVIMGSATFVVPGASTVDHEYEDNGHGQSVHARRCRCLPHQLSTSRSVRDFYPCDPETFERPWESDE